MFLKLKLSILVNQQRLSISIIFSFSHLLFFLFKFRIGHDNANKPLADWLLVRVAIYIPKLSQTWIFPCGKWLSDSKDERQLEVELFPNIIK